MTSMFEKKWVWMDAGEHGYLVCMENIYEQMSFKVAHFEDRYSHSLMWEFPEPDDDEDDLERRDLLIVACIKKIDEACWGPRNWTLA